MIAYTPPEYSRVLKDCMNSQGFEYLITMPERLISQSDLNALLEEVASLNPTSSLYRNRYGYGVTTVGAYLDVGNVQQDLSTDFLDHGNAELLDQMSEGEVLAWLAALHGPKLGQLLDPFRDPDYQPSGEELGEDLFKVLAEPGGCSAEAAPFLENDIGMSEEDSELLGEQLLQISGSEGYVVLEQEWARCAADEGFSGLSSIASVTNLLFDKFEELRSPESIGGAQLERLLGLTRQELDSLSLDEIEERLEATPFQYTLEDLERLQQEELELAHRLQHCDRAYWEGYAELEDRLFPDS